MSDSGERPDPPTKPAPGDPRRRRFLLQTMQACGVAAFGGLVWGAYLDEVRSAPLVLRPPGALNGPDFMSACIKCGLCVEACEHRPNRQGRKTTLSLAHPGDQKPTGTPYFDARESPCFMCEDIPCVQACPTGALDASRVSNESGELDINRAQMGVAVVDPNSCVAYHDWGLRCDICYRACPRMDEAITLKYERNERTGKHAFLAPVIHADACTGCGICEARCITEKPSISIFPRDVVLGKTGDHYLRGWEAEDERLRSDKLRGRAEERPVNTTPRTQNVQDYVNDAISFE